MKLGWYPTCLAQRKHSVNIAFINYFPLQRTIVLLSLTYFMPQEEVSQLFLVESLPTDFYRFLCTRAFLEDFQLLNL